MSSPRETRRKLLRFALSLPEAWEDHPWGEAVAKVGAKVFVFFGTGENPEHVGMSVKLDESLEQALMVPGAKPTAYGLGKAGWANIPFGEETPPVEVLRDWVEESYRRVAPKRLVADLDGRPPRR